MSNDSQADGEQAKYLLVDTETGEVIAGSTYNPFNEVTVSMTTNREMAKSQKKKSGPFAVIVILVLIAGLFLGRMTDKSYEKGYEAGQEEILDGWTSQDMLDYVRAENGIWEIIDYAKDHDRDAFLDCVCEDFDQEEILDRLHINYYSVKAVPTPNPTPIPTPVPTQNPLLTLSPSPTDNPLLGGSTRTISESSITVYVTKTGSKYHREGCSYLKSKIAMSLSDAKAAGYTPCSRCW